LTSACFQALYTTNYGAMDEYSIMYTYVDDSFRFSALLRVYDLIVRSGVTITSLSLFSFPFAERFSYNTTPFLDKKARTTII
jgi:hypothetical protein